MEPAHGADVLVLVVDIANRTQAIALFPEWPVPVLYLAGNHEFYGPSFEQTRIDLRHAANESNQRSVCQRRGGRLAWQGGPWLQEHVHISFDYWVDGCRMVANPLGYSRNRSKVEKACELKSENLIFQRSPIIDSRSPNLANAKDCL